MALEIEVKIPEDAFKRFGERVKNFPEQLAAELVTWQIVDMHRQYPNVERPDEFTVETEVWPRSRLSKKYKPHGVRGRPRGHGRPVKAKPPRKGRPLHSTRPIVRPSLIEQLKERIRVLISELTWAK